LTSRRCVPMGTSGEVRHIKLNGALTAAIGPAKTRCSEVWPVCVCMCSESCPCFHYAAPCLTPTRFSLSATIGGALCPECLVPVVQATPSVWDSTPADFHVFQAIYPHSATVADRPLVICVSVHLSPFPQRLSMIYVFFKACS
jgi:hypothetical protein